MALIPTVEAGSLLNALRLGRSDRQGDDDRRLQQMFMQQKMQEAQDLRTTRQEAGALYASGNRRGARDRAVVGGDFDYATALSKLEASDQEAIKARSEVIGNVAQWADTPEKWDRGIDQLVNMGYADLAQYKGKFSPESRMAAISAAGQVKEYFERQKPVNMAPGNRLVDPTTGKVIASAPFAPRPITIGEGDTVIEYAPGAGGSPDDIFSRMIGAESNGNQFAADGSPLTSPAGAIGIAQVMPGTAPEAAALAGVPFDEERYKTDPQYNAQLGRAYFEKQLQDFGDPALAVAAYNAGPGAVQKALERGGRDGWINFVPAETQGYVQKVLGGGGGSRVIGQGPPKGKGTPPSGYRWAADGNLEPIPGGPAYPKGAGNRNTTSDRKAAADLRKEFNARQEIKDFKEVRTSFMQIRSVATNPKATPQDDIALVFSFMKMLDPGSVVREGEFALAGRAAGLPGRIVLAMQRVDNGAGLTPEQRREMLMTANRVYQPREAAYNRIAEEYQSYARDYGIDPNSIARKYVPPKRKAAPASTGGWGKAKVVQ